MSPWLHVVGIGPDGYDSLLKKTKRILGQITTIISHRNHRHVAEKFNNADLVNWEGNLDVLINEIIPRYQGTGQQIGLLVTGNPLWYSSGSLISHKFPKEDVCFYPQISAFQLACIRMHWSIQDVTLTSVLGTNRPVEGIARYFSNNSRIVTLTGKKDEAGEIASLLVKTGFPESKITVLGSMGGSNEIRLEGIARQWDKIQLRLDFPDYYVLCINCIAEKLPKLTSLLPGLPDTLYKGDNNFTKSDVRAITVCALYPGYEKVLWDLGTGIGTVAIEWARAAPGSQVFATDCSKVKLVKARDNAKRLFVPHINFILGNSIDLLTQLPDPDSVFIGGGLNIDLVETVIDRLKPNGRLVVNSVTLESEALLFDFHEAYGGQLIDISIAKASPIGKFRGWNQMKPVKQWRYEH